MPIYTERYVETCIIGCLVIAKQRKLGDIETGEYIMAELKDMGVLALTDSGPVLCACPKCSERATFEGYCGACHGGGC